MCLFVFGGVIGCHKEPKQVTGNKEYAIFLEPSNHAVRSSAEIERNFWEKKMMAHPEQVSYLAPLASAYSQIFDDMGDIKNLLKAEKLLQKANEKTIYRNAGLLRGLAKVYISRHRFKESLILLQKAYTLGVKRRSTQKMLFDVHMELGDYEQAESYLDQIKKEGDFDYFIRMSKWMDHKGDLDLAIHYMRSAADLAKKSGKEALICWTYSNLADYYGHAGKIEKAYKLYLKVLDMNPDYLYALRGIAWIAFSHDKNAEEAERIIDAIAQIRLTPDLLLFKAELAEFKGRTLDKEKSVEQYSAMLADGDYGIMYNKYTVLVQAENPENTQKAVETALEEVKNRPTPQSYDLLAWAYFNRGDLEKSLEITERYVENQTFEPESEFHRALIYKANGLEGKSEKLKKRLLRSGFELGPNIQRELEML